MRRAVATAVCVGGARDARARLRLPTSARTTTPASSRPTRVRVFFPAMAALGLKQSVMTVRFVPSDPTTIQTGTRSTARSRLRSSPGSASARRLPVPAAELEDGRRTPGRVRSVAPALAERYPTVKQYVVLNEPNQPAFLRPQFDAARDERLGGQSGRFLAAGYDALKAADPAIRVIGLGLSPRGNDLPTAASNVSTSPVRFLAALGAWYRQSGRTRPLMDGLSFHPYPNKATDPLDAGIAGRTPGSSTSTGSSRRVWDAFRDTAQPTTVDGLKLYLDEVGWQVDTSATPRVFGQRKRARHRRGVAGRGSTPRLVRAAACDPHVARAEHLRVLRRPPPRHWLPGRAEPRRRHTAASAEAVHAAIAATAGGCACAPPWVSRQARDRPVAPPGRSRHGA